MTTQTTDQPTEPATHRSLHIAAAASTRRRRWNWGLLALVAVVGAFLPFILNPAELSVATRIIIFALMGIGWNMMSGYGGMFSFGHAAYFGIGAYTTAFLLVDVGINPWLGMLAGMIVAAAAAVLISYLALRYKVKGAYYALSTFAFAEMLRLFVIGNEGLNRTIGFTVPVVQGDNWAMFQFPADSPNYFWIGTVMLIVAMVISMVYLHSRSGRFAVAARDDDMAAAALGIPVLRHKLTVSAISAAITAAAGTFYLQFYMFVDPEIAFGHAVSNNAIITAVVGGVGVLWGPLVGAIIVAPLSDWVATLLRNPPEWLAFLSGLSGLDILIYAVILIVFVLALPKGIVGTILSRKRK